MRKILIATLCLFAAAQGQAQHSAQYSQYMFNGLLLNPAYAGSSDVLSIVLLNRNQWTGFEGAPSTCSVSAHTPLKNKKLNFGFSLLNDRYGITSRTKFDITYAYRLELGKGSLAFGIQGGVNVLRTNWSKVQTTTAGDLVFTTQDEVASTPRAGAGIYYQGDKFYAGASVPTMLSTVEGILYKPVMVTSGYVFSLGEEMKLKHSFLLKHIKNEPVGLDLNTNVYYQSFGLGFSYRTSDAVVFLLEYGINEQFRAGYAYDMTISKLGTYCKGSHEVMLRYEFKYGVTAKDPRYF